MAERSGNFLAGDDPFILARAWLCRAEVSERQPDPNAIIALASVDGSGLPNVRMVLLKEIEVAGQGEGAFVFYTNYESAKGQELSASGKAAFGDALEKPASPGSGSRSGRARGGVRSADAYYASRSLKSRLGGHGRRDSRARSTAAPR